MKTLLPVRSTKAIDQRAMSYGSADYVPLENHQTWTLDGQLDVGMNYIAVYQCVRVLSNVFASVPLKLYRRRSDGGKDEATDHPLYRVLHLQPNPVMTSFVWRKLAMRHLATWGNHYSEITFDGAGRMQLWPIRPDRIEVKWGDNGQREYWYLNGPRRKLKPGTVFHMQGQTTDGLIGSSPITELRRTLGLAMTAERYGTSVFSNGARPAVVMSHPSTLSPGAIDRLAGQMDTMRGSGNAGKTVILEEGMTVTPIGFPPEDAQFLETRLTQHRLIYGAYGVPNHKVNDLEKATFSNIEHQALEFIQDGALPWYVNAEQEFATQLIPEDDVFAEFLVDGLLRGDAKSRAEALAIRWQHGTLSPDEWRSLENENPLDGGVGNRYYVPVNYQEAGVEEVPVAEPTSPPQLFSVKSAAVHCPKGHLLAEMATAPYRFTCRLCKTVTEAQATKSADPMLEAIVALSEREQSAPVVNIAEGAINAAPPVVNVQAPVVNVPAPVVNVAPPDTEPFTDAMLEVRAVLAKMSQPRNILRDKDGRIVGLS